jgi:hypothetical protein
MLPTTLASMISPTAVRVSLDGAGSARASIAGSPTVSGSSCAAGSASPFPAGMVHPKTNPPIKKPKTNIAVHLYIFSGPFIKLVYINLTTNN